VAIEDTVFTKDSSSSSPYCKDNKLPTTTRQQGEHDNKGLQPRSSDVTMEKQSTQRSSHTHFIQNKPRHCTVKHLVQRLLLFTSMSKHTQAIPNPANMPLRRMARTRRLVTSLGRLLSTKAEVIAQIRKRLASGTKPEDAEVAMYMGDIQGQ
jgi:magnesium transporter